MANCGVYEIVNLINNKRYVGSSKDLKTRRANHFSGRRSNPHMQWAMKKYGIENFVFNVLEYVQEEDLLRVEQFYIDTLNPEYNICRVAGSRLGASMSEEAKAKISKAVKERVISDETRERLRQANLGKKASEETRKKLSEAHTGVKLSEEHKRRIGDAHRGKKHSDESKSKMAANRSTCKVLCLTNNTLYESVKHAAISLNINLMSIYYAFRKADKSIHGYVFERIEKLEESNLEFV